MRTRASICVKKKSYLGKDDASLAASRADIILHPYACERCGKFHLTSRTKGRRLPRPSA
jgi:hypothetical protein